MYVNGILLALCELIGYVSLIPFAHKTPRRALNLTVIFLVTVIGLSLIVISPRFLDFEFIKLLQTFVSAFLIKLLVCLDYGLVFNYMSETFNTECRAAGVGIAVFAGRVVGALAPFIIDTLTKVGVHPMVGCCAFGIIAFPVALMLPETLDRKLK
jgi:MFS family permease